jgi:hypothetical protein
MWSKSSTFFLAVDELDQHARAFSETRIPRAGFARALWRGGAAFSLCAAVQATHSRDGGMKARAGKRERAPFSTPLRSVRFVDSIVEMS